MNKTLGRIPAYWLSRYLGAPAPQPLNLTVSVTGDCNSKCATCRIWQKKSGREFTLSEFEKTFDSMSCIYWLTLSGGEPLLREDLADVAAAAYARLRPEIINVPTNGLASDTASKVREIARRCPNSKVVVNVSFDGAGREGDEIRGVKGAANSAAATVRTLKALDEPNLVVGVHSVISKFNVDGLPELFDAVMNLAPDSYVTEVAEERVELGNVGSKVAPSERGSRP